MVQAFVITRLDYCNALCCGITDERTAVSSERCHQARDDHHAMRLSPHVLRQLHCMASFLYGSASCSTLRLSSAGLCPATPRVTWPTTASSSSTPVSDNCVLPTLTCTYLYLQVDGLALAADQLLSSISL